MRKMIQNKTFRYIDHTNEVVFSSEKFTGLTSFAIDDALALAVSNKFSPPTMRLWLHPKTIVLGIPDGRLPFIDEGVKLLAEEGYHVIIRNSGGLAVALDEGVLNISLILPDAKKSSIHDCYDAMFQFIQYTLRDVTDKIKAYEIVGSYCPGDYDLSIDGIKFAGISQRRIQDGAAIQIYLDVEGDSKKRASLIRNFYDVSLKGEKTKFIYPVVEHEKMGSLTGLLGRKVTVAEMKERVQSTLGELSEHIVTPDFSEYELERFQSRYHQMVKRNERIAELQ